MPAIRPGDLVAATIDAVEQSGHTAVLLGAARHHPRRFVITTSEGASVEMWVYAWTHSRWARKPSR